MSAASLDAYVDAFKARDASAYSETLAADVRIHSPVKHSELSGRAFASMVMRMFFEGIDDIEIVDTLTGARSAALITRFSLNECRGELLHHLSFDEAGKIERLRLMVRPFSMAKQIIESVSGRVAVN